MGFKFNPSLWFVCRLCRMSFPSTEILKEHKLACHLEECLQIKCIIFEEKLVDQEWMPENIYNSLFENENPVLNANVMREKRSSLKEYRNKVQLNYGLSRKSSFKNPYVLLTRLPEQKVKSSNNSSKCGGKLSRKRKHLGRSDCADQDQIDNNTGSEITENDFIAPQASSSKHYIHSHEESEFQNEFLTYEVPTATSLGANESNFDNFEDVESDFQEYKVTSVSPNSDGFPRIQSAYTLIPASSQENQLLQQQYQNIPCSDSETSPVYLAHQEMLSNNETNDFDSNLTIVEIKIDTYDSDLFNTTQAVHNQEQEPQARGFDEDLDQESLPPNCQSETEPGKVEKPFMCETCFAFFTTRSVLKQHMLCHSSSKPFKCSQCPSRFKRRDVLVNHQVVHGMRTNFKCRFCSKCFSRSHHLLVHERRHTGDKPFKCTVANCDYAASSKGDLVKHIRVKHCEELGLQQFVCHTCGKTYGIKSQLDFHTRNHHSDATPSK